MGPPWPKGFTYYPKFSCLSDEIGWLQMQVSRMAGEVEFLLSLRRLQYDVSDGLVQLKDLYKLKLDEVSQERDFYMAETARLGAQVGKHIAPPAAFPKGRWASNALGGLG